MQSRTAFETIETEIANKQVELIKKLIETYNKHLPDALLLRNTSHKSLLQLAVEHDLADVANLLFSLQRTNAAILFDEDGSGGNLLFQTVQHGMFTLTKELVAIAQRQRADTPGHRIWFKADSFNFTLLHAATYTQQSTDMLRFLLETAKDDAFFYKFIHQQILDNSKVPSGSTALHIACSKNQPALAELLIRYGARLDITNDAGETPFEVIPKEEHDAFVLYLAERGALLGQRVNRAVANKLSALSVERDILLVGVTLENRSIATTSATISSQSTANPDDVKLSYHALFWHKNLRGLPTNSMAFSSATENDMSDHRQFNQDLTMDLRHDNLDSFNLLLQDQEKLVRLIASLVSLETNLRARPVESRKTKIVIVLTILLLIATPILLQTSSVIGRKKLEELLQNGKIVDNNALEAAYFTYWILGEISNYNLIISIPILSILAITVGLIQKHNGYPVRLWKRNTTVDKQEWQPLLDEAKAILEQLQSLQEKETQDNTHNRCTAISYLPVEVNFLTEFQQHITALATNLPITAAITALLTLKDDLIRLQNRLKITQKPFSLFSQPLKNTDAIIEIPSDDDELEPEGNDGEAPLLRRNRPDNVDDGHPPARPK